MTSKRWLAALCSSVALAAVLGAGSAGAANMTLKNLMKKMGSTAANEDVKGLVPLLTQASGMKPADPAFAGWDAIADKAKAAAEQGDLVAVKATCKECHDKYRDAYKTKYGSKAP
jgi:cytochrome c556